MDALVSAFEALLPSPVLCVMCWYSGCGVVLPCSVWSRLIKAPEPQQNLLVTGFRLLSLFALYQCMDRRERPHYSLHFSVLRSVAFFQRRERRPPHFG
jgi:hypothetical protein